MGDVVAFAPQDASQSSWDLPWKRQPQKAKWKDGLRWNSKRGSDVCRSDALPSLIGDVPAHGRREAPPLPGLRAELEVARDRRGPAP